MSWYWLPSTLTTLPCCSQSWCGWHGSVLEVEEEKKPRGQALHWVFSKGVPVNGEGRGCQPGVMTGQGAGDDASGCQASLSTEGDARAIISPPEQSLPAAPLGSVCKQQRLNPPPQSTWHMLIHEHRCPETGGELICH